MRKLKIAPKIIVTGYVLALVLALPVGTSNAVFVTGEGYSAPVDAPDSTSSPKPTTAVDAGISDEAPIYSQAYPQNRANKPADLRYDYMIFACIVIAALGLSVLIVLWAMNTREKKSRNKKK